MLARLSHTQLLRYAGLFTWAMVGVPLLAYFVYPPELPLPEEGLAATPTFNLTYWTIAYLAFGPVYWWLTRALSVRRPRWSDEALLLVLTSAAIAVSHFSGTGLGGMLLIVVAGLLPWLLAVPIGVVWLFMSYIALVPAFTEGQGFSLIEAVLQSFLYVGYSSFTFVISLVAKQQAQAREEQRRLNSELRATRALLAESTRLNERTRISRELHDLLGHHLTALSLNLEVASHLSSGKVQEHVRQAHTLAKLLLTDVREAVSQLREDGSIDLSGALRTLVEGVPALEIRLDLPELFTLDDPERAHVLLRCTQEIITNAVRHSDARTLWLRFGREGSALCLHARDDGRGAEQMIQGHGLRGMRERLAEYGGRVDIVTARGQGFALDLLLPLDSFEDAARPRDVPAAEAP